MRLIVLAALLCGNLAAVAQAPTPRAVQNIETFARLYGYVRYFHPSDEAAATDWNRLAVLGCQRVEAAQTEAELQNILLSLFRPIAPTLQLVRAGKNYRFNPKDITPPNPSAYQVISWQHQGMGQNDPRSPYKSRRTHRLVAAPTNNARGARFGSLTRAVDATPYQGKEFRYRVSVRNAKPTQGPGALWFRVDRTNKSLGFFDNMDDRPIVRGEWADYEIKGTIDEQASMLVFGAMLHGSGQIEVDNMRVEVQDSGNWKSVFATSFEDDLTGRYPQSINPNAVAFSTATNYSYLVSEANATEGRKSVVISSADSTAGTDAPPLFAKQAAIGEVVQEDIGSGLRCVLPLALYGTKQATYPAADTTAWAALRKDFNQILIGDMTGDNRAVRLADVVITWNIFQHFYPYFAVTDSHWSAALPEALRTAYPNQSGTDFLRTLRRLTAYLHDGHVRVTDYRSSRWPIYRLPIEWEWVQDKLVITRVVGDSLPLQRGDIVTTINGQPAAAYFQTAEQYISAATPGWLHYRAAYETTAGQAGTVAQLQVQNEAGTTRSVRLQYSLAPNQLTADAPAKETFRRISSSVYYLDLDQIQMPEIDKLLPELRQAKAIICDLRGYPKSNHAFLAHLLSRPDTVSGWMRVPQYIYPDQKRVAGYMPLGWHMQPKAPHLKARIIFITDGRAISYAESYMGYVEGYKLATIIGQPTAGTNGNINPFALPGNYQISWTGMEVRKHNGSQHHGIGITPNIYLEKTIQGVREGRDEFLEKAIELANAQ